MFYRRKLLESYVAFTPGHTQPLFQLLHLLSINQIRDYFVAIFMYKMKNNMMPAHFSQLFTSASEIHNYPTKFAERNSLYVHVVPNKRGKRTIRHFGRKLWNIVLDAIDVNCSIGSFKLRLKSFLFSSLYKDACQELLKFDVWDESLFPFFFNKYSCIFFFLSITCLCCLVRIICFVFLSNFINCEASKVVICLMVLNMHPAPCDLAPCYWI